MAARFEVMNVNAIALMKKAVKRFSVMYPNPTFTFV